MLAIRIPTSDRPVLVITLPTSLLVTVPPLLLLLLLLPYCTVGFSKDRMGHGYFRDHRQVLADVSHAFEGHTRPPHRTSLMESIDGEEWKCRECNDKVAPDPRVVLYRCAGLC